MPCWLASKLVCCSAVYIVLGILRGGGGCFMLGRLNTAQPPSPSTSLPPLYASISLNPCSDGQATFFCPNMNIHVDGNYVNVNYVDIVQWALPIWALFTYNWTKKLLFSVNLYHKLSLSVTFLAQLKRNSFCACICVLQELNASQCL